MRKGTLARFEIYLGAIIALAVFALAGYGLISAFADRLDPKVRDCIERSTQSTTNPVSREEAAAMCKRLEAVGGL